MDDPRTSDNTSGTGENGLRGSATYKGAAAGKYAMASTNRRHPRGRPFHRHGHPDGGFRCRQDCLLLATANDRDGVAISGMIDNFMTGDVSRPDWMVELMVDNDAG